ncbi:hypothetical protein T02_2772, partial [Trichinella nativa]
LSIQSSTIFATTYVVIVVSCVMEGGFGCDKLELSQRFPVGHHGISTDDRETLIVGSMKVPERLVIVACKFVIFASLQFVLHFFLFNLNFHNYFHFLCGKSVAEKRTTPLEFAVDNKLYSVSKDIYEPCCVMPAHITAENRLHDITGDSEGIQEELAALSESKATTTTVDPASQSQEGMPDQIATSVAPFVKLNNRSAKITELEARVEKCQNQIKFLYFVIIIGAAFKIGRAIIGNCDKSLIFFWLSQSECIGEYCTSSPLRVFQAICFEKIFRVKKLRSFVCMLAEQEFVQLGLPINKYLVVDSTFIQTACSVDRRSMFPSIKISSNNEISVWLRKLKIVHVTRQSTTNLKSGEAGETGKINRQLAQLIIPIIERLLSREILVKCVSEP